MLKESVRYSSIKFWSTPEGHGERIGVSRAPTIKICELSSFINTWPSVASLFGLGRIYSAATWERQAFFVVIVGLHICTISKSVINQMR